MDLLFTAWIFNLFLVLASRKNSLLSQDVYLSETRLVRLGACLSRMSEKMAVHLLTATLESLALAIIPSQLTLSGCNIFVLTFDSSTKLPDAINQKVITEASLITPLSEIFLYSEVAIWSIREEESRVID